MDTIERQRILTQLTLFEALPSEALAAIAEEMKYRQYYRGEVIVWQGNPSNILYALTNGIAAVRSQLPGQTSQQTLAYLMPGTSFGEVGILESQPRSASVVALTDVEVLVLHRDAFLRILHEHASVAIELARGLARALQRHACAHLRRDGVRWLHGNIDPERTWGVLTGLAYRASVVGPVAALWVWLVRRVGESNRQFE